MTHILVSLHWQPVRLRVDFQVLLFIFKVLNGLAPSYSSHLLHFTSRSDTFNCVFVSFMQRPLFVMSYFMPEMVISIYQSCTVLW